MTGPSGAGFSRRQLLRAGAIGVTGLAGCNDGLDPDRGENDAHTEQPTGTAPPTTIEDDPVTLDTVRTVGAHYYVWYGPPMGDYRDGEWGLKSPSTPVIGKYDSTDPDVIAQHIDWCHRAGIDWLNASWWGPNEPSHRRLVDDVLAHPRADELDWLILYETTGRLGSGIVDMDDPIHRNQLRADLTFLVVEYFQ